VNDTEENDAFQIDHVRGSQKRQKRQTPLSKEKQIHSQETTRQKELKMLPERRNADRKKNVNKRFQENGKPDYNITDDASQIKEKRIFL